jgi:lecithin-cholesterol acyltransferase
MTTSSMRAVIARLLIIGFLVATLLPSAASAAAKPGVTPIVLFPAYHLTRLRVDVHNQTVAPKCDPSGTFEYWFQNPHPSTQFDQKCQDQFLTLRYAADSDRPMAQRFSNQRGVTVTIPDYGKTQSAPDYDPMFQALEKAGYVRNHSIRVAGYDARLTPDIGDFLARSKKLIEDTYADNGNRPVHVVGHSNGPLYIQYLLTHTSREWRDKFIHGFTPIAGNFPGQGSLYSILFTGLNIIDFSLPSVADQAKTSATLYLTNPSTYMSAADPEIFGRNEVVLQNSTTGKTYTPADYRQLLADAGLQRLRPIADYYIGFVEFDDPAHFPYVDVYAEKGSNIPTQIGAVLPNLTIGQVIDPNTQLILAPGDINQEDPTNLAVGVWHSMKCFHFSLTDNPNVNHFELPGNPNVLKRLVTNAARERSDCSAEGDD